MHFHHDMQERATKITNDTPSISDRKTPKKDIAELNNLLHGERAAVETYGQCIKKVDDVDLQARLQLLRASHQKRCDMLHNRISLMGGTPDDSSGGWGVFAGLVEGSAALIGVKPALDMLLEGEQHGARRYQSLDELSAESRRFVAEHVVPEQTTTLQNLNRLVDAQ